MQLEEAKQEFINTWGILAGNWGINRTMAQIHALLMVSPEPLSTEELMAELNISRGNVNMNVRDLIDWGLVEKVFKAGERKEYFKAEKDIWKVARQVARERKKRELEPVLKVLEQVSKVEGDKNDPQIKAFTETVTGIRNIAQKADKTINTMLNTEENWFFSAILKIMK